MSSKKTSILTALVFAIGFSSLLFVLHLAKPGSFAASPGVRVSGNHFLLNGKSFTPHGFNAIALLHSTWCTNTPNDKAYSNFGTVELGNAKSKWNVNTLRFQVSLPVLASSNGVAYTQQIAADVATVRQAGFVVDISMQDEPLACGPAEP